MYKRAGVSLDHSNRGCQRGRNALSNACVERGRCGKGGGIVSVEGREGCVCGERGGGG